MKDASTSNKISLWIVSWVGGEGSTDLLFTFPPSPSSSCLCNSLVLSLPVGDRPVSKQLCPETTVILLNTSQWRHVFWCEIQNFPSCSSKKWYFDNVESSKFYWVIKLGHFSEFHLFSWVTWFSYHDLLFKVVKTGIITSGSFDPNWASRSHSFHPKLLVLVLVILLLRLALRLAMELPCSI